MMHTMVTNARKINFPALTTLKITQLLHHNIEWVSTLPLLYWASQVKLSFHIVCQLSHAITLHGIQHEHATVFSRGKGE